MRKADLSRFAPPGADVRRMLRLYGSLLGLAALISAFCLLSIWDAHNQLYYLDDTTGERMLNTAAVMPDFASLLSAFPLGFPVVMLLSLSGIGGNLASFYRGSRSIYLMRRLPTRGELFRRVALLPLVGCLLALTVMVVLCALYYLVYRLLTPAECLQPDQLTRLLEFYFDRTAYALRNGGM